MVEPASAVLPDLAKMGARETQVQQQCRMQTRAREDAIMQIAPGL
jgi:hypothetical protein